MVVLLLLAIPHMKLISPECCGLDTSAWLKAWQDGFAWWSYDLSRWLLFISSPILIFGFSSLICTEFILLNCYFISPWCYHSFLVQFMFTILLFLFSCYCHFLSPQYLSEAFQVQYEDVRQGPQTELDAALLKLLTVWTSPRVIRSKLKWMRKKISD